MATIESSGREWWPLFVLCDLPPVPEFPVYGSKLITHFLDSRKEKKKEEKESKV